MPSLGKELMLKELLKALKNKNYLFFSRHQGLSANDFIELRQKLSKVSDRSLVVKNALLKRALGEIGIKDANGLIKGALLITVCEKDPQIASKALLEFAKGKESFQVGGACIEGAVVSEQYVKSLAELPSREVLIATVLGGLNAPISGFVNVLGQLVRSVAIALDQIQKKKAAQAG